MSPTIEDALELVVSRFKGMTDADGEPYVLHCLRVMLGVSDPLAQQAAVMHDLIEDTDVSLDDLKQLGFPDEVIKAVDLVTHRQHETYAEYVVRIRSNELARQVKLSDLKDNAAMCRVLYREHTHEEDTKRIGRYILSSQFLTDRISESDYRRRMAKLEQA